MSLVTMEKVRYLPSNRGIEHLCAVKGRKEAKNECERICESSEIPQQAKHGVSFTLVNLFVVSHPYLI